MKFEGFPASARFTPVPDLFLNRLSPALSADELRLMLAVFSIIYHKKGYPRYVTASELASHPASFFISPSQPVPSYSSSPSMGEDCRSLHWEKTKLRKREGVPTGERARDSLLVPLLSSLAEKGLLLPLSPGAEKSQAVYFLNNPEGQKAVAQAAEGTIKIEGAGPAVPQPAAAPLPDIFTLYEQNFGLLTPMIAEELKDALATYPENWVRDALKEAVALNKRSFRYAQRILERWTVEGKDANGTHRPDTERDKFVRGRYGGLVQR